MNVLGLSFAVAIACALTVSAQAEEKKDNAKLLVGAWQITKTFDPVIGPPIGAPVEFTKEGKIVFSGKVDGKEQSFEGIYKIDGDKFTVTAKIDDKEEKKTFTITKLSDKELVTSDEKGRQLEFKRK